MLRNYKREIIFFYACSVCALVFASFFDLKLDIWLNSPENPVAVWFRNTGEIPCRLICPVAGAAIFCCGEKKLTKIAGALINIGGSAYLGYYLGKYFFLEEYRMSFDIIFGVGCGAVLLVACIFIKVPQNLKKPVCVIAVTGIAVMAVQLLAVEIMKTLWGRVRFRDLLASGNYDEFTPWYIISGKNGNKSFPSGHTAGAGMSYLMMFFPYLSEKCEKRKTLCFAVPFVYTSVVAFTRLVMGAHYLSDVTIGGVVSFTLVIIAMKIYEKVSEKIKG